MVQFHRISLFTTLHGLRHWLLNIILSTQHLITLLLRNHTKILLGSSGFFIFASEIWVPLSKDRQNLGAPIQGLTKFEYLLHHFLKPLYVFHGHNFSYLDNQYMAKSGCPLRRVAIFGHPIQQMAISVPPIKSLQSNQPHLSTEKFRKVMQRAQKEALMQLVNPLRQCVLMLSKITVSVTSIGRSCHRYVMACSCRVLFGWILYCVHVTWS